MDDSFSLVVKMAVLDFCANDFEAYEDVAKEVEQWMRGDGLLVNRDIIDASTAELVQRGSLSAHKLAPGRNPTPISLGSHRLDEKDIYLLTTEKGLMELERLSKRNRLPNS